MFEFLLSADMKVDDPDEMARSLVDRIGVHENPRWRMANPGSNYIAWFLRVHPSLAVAPTRLEPQGHFPGENLADPAFTDYLDSVVEYQGVSRPMKTHSTILVTRDLEGVIDGLSARRVPFRLSPVTDQFPFPRLWVGVTPEHSRYDPTYDGGLCVEVMPMAPMQMPSDTAAAPEPVDPEPGSLVRVVERGVLVRNLDDVLHRLAENLSWEPVGPVESLREAGVRRARMAFRLPHSSSFDLLEPVSATSDAGIFLHTWGPGPYYTRISVHDLGSKEEDLRRRGTNFSRVGEGLRIDSRQLHGSIIELVEHAWRK